MFAVATFVQFPQPTDWLGRMSPLWPILCWVGCVSNC